MSTPPRSGHGVLWRRYRDVLQAAWAERKAVASPPRHAHEAAFLPAHLELVETPPHPAPRWAMRLLAALTVLALLVSLIGKLDIVVVAQGELIPDSNVKVVQPAVTGVIRAIHVRDGQEVQAGQPLIELDVHQAAADASTARTHRVHAALAMSRAQAMLQAVASGNLGPLSHVDDSSAVEQQQSDDLARQSWQAYLAKHQDAQGELAARQAELASTQQEVAKLAATAPLARQQADTYRALAARNDVAPTEYLDRERAALELSHGLTAQRAHALQSEARVKQQQYTLAGLDAQFLRDQRQELDKATQEYAISRSEETKAITRQGLMTLSAPVAGTVQQLSVHTLGGVVTTAQPLMEIVPDDHLRVKATINNRDVGFVQAGQPVVVKVAAFPYTHYGYLTGTVMGLANDAAQDKKRGSVFVAYVKLDSNRIRADQRWITLTTGMSVNAEITTGRRRVISYFLGPLVQSVQESLHER